MPRPLLQPPVLDALYQGYGKNLYRLTGDEQEDEIMNMISAPSDGSAAATGIGGMTIPADSIDSGASASSTVQATGSATKQGKTTFDNVAAGYILGFDPSDGYAKFYIGNSTNYLNWNGTTLTIVGSISASSINIPDATTANSFHVDSSGNTWWGANVATGYAGAPAYVLATGVALFSSVTVTGTVNATGGYIGSATALVYEAQGINTGTTGYIRGGQTAYNTGTGYFLGYESANYKFSIGNPATDYLTWDGTNLTVTALTVSQNFTAAETLAIGDASAIGPYQSDGGVSFDAKATSSPTGAIGGTYSTTFSVGANSNRELVVYVITQSSASVTATYGGVSMTSVINVANPSGGLYMWAFKLAAPTTGSNTLAIAGLGVSENIGLDIRSYYNVDQTGPIASSNSTTAAGLATISQPITPVNDGAMLLTAVLNTNIGTFTYTNMSQNSGDARPIQTNFGMNVGDSYKLANKKQISVSATRSAGTSDWSMITLEFKPAAAVSYYIYKAAATNGTSYGWNTNWKANAFIGFAASTSTVGNPISVVTSGTAPGLSSLLVTEQYYLSDTGGQISLTAGTNTRKVGIAAAATKLTITNIW